MVLFSVVCCDTVVLTSTLSNFTDAYKDELMGRYIYMTKYFSVMLISTFR